MTSPRHRAAEDVLIRRAAVRLGLQAAAFVALAVLLVVERRPWCC